MKFPRNARILRSQLDAAPLASVFFLLVIFVLLGTVVYQPGVRVQLPVAENLPGVDRPTITVKVDAGLRLFFANQLVTEAELKTNLSRAMTSFTAPPTLVVQADKSVTHEFIMRLTLLAPDAGIREALLAVAPRLAEAPAKR